MIGLYLCLGAGDSVLWPLLSAYAAEEGRTHFGHGAMMGVFNFAMSIGVFTGAIFSGVSIDKWGAGISFYLLAGDLGADSLRCLSNCRGRAGG